MNWRTANKRKRNNLRSQAAKRLAGKPVDVLLGVMRGIGIPADRMEPNVVEQVRRLLRETPAPEMLQNYRKEYVSEGRTPFYLRVK